jgi:heme/copper-type cytochrome/quinol oxidase subunit 3
VSIETVSTSSDAPEKKIPGEAGVWVFIVGDTIVFAVLLTVYLAECSKQRRTSTRLRRR